MEIIKDARIKSFKVDTYYYSQADLDRMIDDNLIESFRYSNTTYRIFTDKIKEIKVIYDIRYEEYLNVVVIDNEKTIIIKL